jgi:hypothetical protein
MKHYLIKIVVIILTILSLALTYKELPYIPLIFPTIMLIYVLIYQPYKFMMENVRAAFNYVVILSILFYRVYLEYICDEANLNSTASLIYFLINMIILLILVTVIGIIAILYGYYFENYKQPKL